MKKLIAAFVGIMAILLVVFFVTRPKSIKHVPAFQSDVLATNINNPEPVQGKLAFFTGSNTALLDLTKENTSTTTSTVVPLSDASKVVWMSDGALVKLNQLPEDSYLLTKLSSQQQQTYHTNSSWWHLTSSGIQLVEFPGIESSRIQDIFIGDKVYITFKDTKSDQYGVGIYDSITATQPVFKKDARFELPVIIGGSQSTIYVRLPAGNIFSVAASGEKVIVDQSFSAKWEASTKSIVISSELGSKNATNDEGEKSSSGSYELSAYSTDTESLRKLIKTSQSQLYTGDGRVFIPAVSGDSLSITEYNLSSNTQQIYDVSGGKFTADSFSGLVADRSYIYVTDNLDNLSVISTNPDTITSFTGARLVKTNQRTIESDTMTIDYNLTTNVAQIYLSNSNVASAPDIIQSQLPAIQNSLGDSNQVSLQWFFADGGDEL